MNGPVAPPAVAQPGHTRSATFAATLGRVLLAPIRALAFFGLTLAGAVLLVVCVRSGAAGRGSASGTSSQDLVAARAR